MLDLMKFSRKAALTDPFKSLTEGEIPSTAALVTDEDMRGAYSLLVNVLFMFKMRAKNVFVPTLDRHGVCSHLIFVTLMPLKETS